MLPSTPSPTPKPEPLDEQPILDADHADVDDDDSPAAPDAPPAATTSSSLRTRLLLLLISVALVFVAMRMAMPKAKPQVVYANRYSKEHKFRPAASPIITETLKDGRTRLRGAAPTTQVITPKETVAPKAKGKTKTGKTKKKTGKKKKKPVKPVLKKHVPPPTT
ncbi:hypothetical protein MKEN_00970500 [Mycena kentingensis (nom. inval.)]|nr:hypothetical protein MKEN_00970500 [Mycena kentingensis (nom. inval.)]